MLVAISFSKSIYADTEEAACMIDQMRYHIRLGMRRAATVRQDWGYAGRRRRLNASWQCDQLRSVGVTTKKVDFCLCDVLVHVCVLCF